MPLLTTAATAAIAAAIGNFFQKRQFQFKEKEGQRAEFRAHREAFVNQIMKRVSTRVFNLIRVIRMLKDVTLTEAEIDARMDDYNASIEDTLVNYSIDLVYLKEFFNSGVSHQYQQIMEGPGGFVKLNSAWRELYKEYTDVRNNVFPATKPLSSEPFEDEDKKQYLLDRIVKVKALQTKAEDLGYSPIGNPFYTTIARKEGMSFDGGY